GRGDARVREGAARARRARRCERRTPRPDGPDVGRGRGARRRRPDVDRGRRRLPRPVDVGIHTAAVRRPRRTPRRRPRPAEGGRRRQRDGPGRGRTQARLRRPRAARRSDAAAGLATRSPGEDAGTEPEVIEALQVLLDLGADINAVDKNGETAMHAAAYKNLPGVVKFLASKGAKIDVWNKPDKFGWTPLAIA